MAPSAACTACPRRPRRGRRHANPPADRARKYPRRGPHPAGHEYGATLVTMAASIFGSDPGAQPGQQLRGRVGGEVDRSSRQTVAWGLPLLLQDLSDNDARVIHVERSSLRVARFRRQRRQRDTSRRPFSGRGIAPPERWPARRVAMPHRDRSRWVDGVRKAIEERVVTGVIPDNTSGSARAADRLSISRQTHRSRLSEFIGTTYSSGPLHVVRFDARPPGGLEKTSSRRRSCPSLQQAEFHQVRDAVAAFPPAPPGFGSSSRTNAPDGCLTHAMGKKFASRPSTIVPTDRSPTPDPPQGP